jgi:hypothetical protein
MYYIYIFHQTTFLLFFILPFFAIVYNQKASNYTLIEQNFKASVLNMRLNIFAKILKWIFLTSILILKHVNFLQKLIPLPNVSFA